MGIWEIFHDKNMKHDVHLLYVNYLAYTGWIYRVEVKYFCWNWIIDNDNKKSDQFFFKMFRRSFDSKQTQCTWNDHEMILIRRTLPSFICVCIIKNWFLNILV